MKLILLLACINLFLYVTPAIAKTCEECPASKPCTLIIPKGDKCNTCELKVHCSDGFWYSDKKACTNIDCNQLTPIENPYEADPEKSV